MPAFYVNMRACRVYFATNLLTYFLDDIWGILYHTGLGDWACVDSKVIH